ncbi:MAG TPA: TIGR02281 family clan AA aspartic protease [Planctomycetaceae bacterium]|nr:TIGR02281 family clan AA aspartic protease [Planctomycetaceae bacterium]
MSADVPTIPPPPNGTIPAPGPDDFPERIGRYRLTKVLGQGGFGVVYLAVDEDLERLVAVKVPLPHRVADAEAYLAEARILASLDYPNIVTVHDVGRTENGACFVVSKFIEGTNLRGQMKASRLLPTHSAEIVATVADALHFAHTRGIVHRDIKPENILIDGSGLPYVADFGIALRDVDFAKESESKLLGSPTYMSPEQAKGAGHLVDGRSDIFSLGVVLYELLTGVNPFRAANLANTLLLIATVEPKPPRQINDSIPKELECICLKALSKKPTDRFTTAKDFGEELRGFLQHCNERNPPQDTPRVFGVGIRKLSPGQFGCALVIGTLALLVAVLPISLLRFNKQLEQAGDEIKRVTLAKGATSPEMASPASKRHGPATVPSADVNKADEPIIVRTQPPIEPMPPLEPKSPAPPRLPRRESSSPIPAGVVRAEQAPPRPSGNPPSAAVEMPGELRRSTSMTDTLEARARAKLSEKGVLVSHSGLLLSDEKELAKAFADANALKRKLLAAAKEQQAAVQQVEELQAKLRQLHQASLELNSQLADIGSDVARRNQLTGALNANIGEITILEQTQEQARKDVDGVRKKSDAARDGYVQQVAELRSLIDRLSERYAALKSDVDVHRALAEWNTAANTSFEIKPSSYFLNSVKKLESLEKTVAMERIPLRRKGNSYFASVVINGKAPQEMIVDTGASSVVLPYDVAIECGVKPDESTATVISTVADGSKVKSKLVLLDSVRIGKFTAEHVECVVLPPGEKNAAALLGMTYLSRFDFSINGTELVLSKIEGDHTPVKSKKPASKTPRRARKATNPVEPAE